MVRIILIILISFSFLISGIIDEKIKNFVGQNRYYSSKKIIDVLIGDKNSYVKKNGNIKILKILKILKENGFLNFILKKPQKITISFYTKNNPILFLKILNESLAIIGYNFFTTKKSSKNSDGFTWVIQMETEYIVDPVVFGEELKKRNCEIIDIIKKSNTEWSYNISVENAKLLAKKIMPGGEYKLKKPIKAYWLYLENNLIKELKINSFPPNRWHPFIIFYDKDLNVISTIVKNEKINKIKLNIPVNTKYIFIDDKYTLDNIRSGLRVYAK